MESGSQEIYVQPFPGLGAKIRISTQTGGTPLVAQREGVVLLVISPGAAVAGRGQLVRRAPPPRPGEAVNRGWS